MSGAASSETPEAAAQAPSASAGAGKPSWRVRARRWLVDLTLFALVLLAVGFWQRRNLLPANDGPAPQMLVHTLEGAPVTLADFAGQPVQLHFWGTWCSVCRREHGALNAVHAANEGSNRTLLAIAVDSGTAEELRAYVDENDLAYRVLIDDGSAAAAYQVNTFPTNYYLNAEHEIASRDVGMASRWGMRLRGWSAAR